MQGLKYDVFMTAQEVVDQLLYQGDRFYSGREMSLFKGKVHDFIPCAGEDGQIGYLIDSIKFVFGGVSEPREYRVHIISIQRDHSRKDIENYYLERSRNGMEFSSLKATRNALKEMK